MQNEFLNIGSSPAGEACTPVEHPEYHRRSRIECEVFGKQLKRELRAKFDIPQDTELPVRIISKVFPHDFGSYREVVCYYDPQNPLSIEMAFFCESKASEEWDVDSQIELAQRLASTGEGE